MRHAYHINVFWSDEDGCWVADIPDLTMCHGFGASPEEALHEALVSEQEWLAAAEEHGNPIPEPRYQPTAATG